MPSRRATLLGGLAAIGSALFAVRAQASDLSGSWSGRWLSCKSGHNGPLNGTFCRLSATSYEVNFRGRFFKVFPFRYSVVLNVVEEYGDYTRLRGSSYLGRMFGTFYYDATVQGNCFTATYTSCKDNGRFTMTRCCG
jgi:hypothetical protein